MSDEPRSELGQQQEPAVPTGPASSPEPVPAGGPRRRSRRRGLVASVVLVGVSLVVGAGVLLVSRQAPSVGRVTPTTTAAPGGRTTSPAGSAEANNKDVGRVPRGDLLERFDASVFLVRGIHPTQRETIRRRVAALPIVEALAYESPAEAFQRFRVLFRDQPDVLRGGTEQVMPASFRLVLHDPSQFAELLKQLCPLRPDLSRACLEEIENVSDEHWNAWVQLSWPRLHTADAVVVLAPGVGPDRRRAIGAELAALPVVERVDFESKAAARRRLQQAREQNPLDMPVPPSGLAHDNFRVRLRVPVRYAELYGRLCSGRWSFSTQPVCKPGVQVVIPNPRSVYYGLER